VRSASERAQSVRVKLCLRQSPQRGGASVCVERDEPWNEAADAEKASALHMPILRPGPQPRLQWHGWIVSVAEASRAGDFT
jgi:hypothetical protein